METMLKRPHISKTAAIGHLRRAQARIGKAFEGDKPDDVLIQAAIGAAGSAVALRLLRGPLGGFVARWAPMLVFAAIYQRQLGARRR